MIFPDHVTEALELFQQRKRSPVTKYAGMLDRTSEDGRFRGSLLYHGPSTGRWSSVGINTQNMLRPARAFDNVEGGANACIPLFYMRDADLIGKLIGRESSAGEAITGVDVLGSCIRGMIKASTGHRLIVVDWSAIEAVITAFLAQSEGMLEEFRGAGKVYELQASIMFKKPVHEISAFERFLGKIAILACGFAGGKGAFLSMAAQYGVDDMPENVAQRYVDQFREGNPEIVNMWGEMEGSAMRAVRNKGKVFVAANGFIKFRCTDEAPYCLQMRLPSGRSLHYWYPEIVAGSKFGNPTIRYSGVNSTTKVWEHIELWRGMIVENAVQAIAADLLRNALIGLDEAGYTIIMHVHDEIVAEMPYGQGSEQEMSEIMCRVPPWFEGMPLRAEGYESKRYHK